MSDGTEHACTILHLERVPIPVFEGVWGVLLECCGSVVGVLLESCESLVKVLLESCWKSHGSLMGVSSHLIPVSIERTPAGRGRHRFPAHTQ